MRKIAIFGAGGFGREVLQIVMDINEKNAEWDFQGFLVDPEFMTENSIHGHPVFDYTTWLQSNEDTSITIAIGSSENRAKVVRNIKKIGHNNFATLIHPNAWIGRFVKIGEGSIVCSGALLTTDITLGEHVHVNIGSTIGHDAFLNDFSTLNPNVSISGGVFLDTGADIGTSTAIVPQRNIGKWTIVGAGSVVLQDIPENTTAVGSPAKPIKVRPTGWELI